MANLLDEVTGHDNDIDRYIHVIDSQHFRVPTEESCTRGKLATISLYSESYLSRRQKTQTIYCIKG